MCDFIEEFLCHGPGDIQGEPLLLDNEFKWFILQAYELYPVDHPLAGRRVYRRAVLSRPKGRAKSELAGALAVAEALGPVRWVEWDTDGTPWGEPIQSPVVRCFATEESQAGNTFDNALFMVEYGKIWEEFGGFDVGKKQINLDDGGSIISTTSSASSKDGGKDTFDVFDEALSLDTLLPTPTGLQKLNVLSVGDLILDDAGSPTRIKGMTPIQHERACYRVTFEDGSSLTASDGHFWMTKDLSTALPRVRTTQEMAETGRRFRVPVAKPWQLAKQNLSVDPYLLGLWLGDGSTGQPNITVGLEDVEAVEH